MVLWFLFKYCVLSCFKVIKALVKLGQFMKLRTPVVYECVFSIINFINDKHSR